METPLRQKRLTVREAYAVLEREGQLRGGELDALCSAAASTSQSAQINNTHDALLRA
jgi:hypothetical protein